MGADLLQPVGGLAPLAHGSLISGMRYIQIEMPPDGSEEIVGARQIISSYAIVLTQMCDLQQDFKARFPEHRLSAAAGFDERDKYLLPNILICEAFDEGDFRNFPQINRKFFEKVLKNDHVRYGVIEIENAADAGAPERLFIDFRRLILIPPEDIYSQIAHEPNVRYLGILPRAYRSHLAQRLFAYYLRVDLPSDIEDIPYHIE